MPGAAGPYDHAVSNFLRRRPRSVRDVLEDLGLPAETIAEAEQAGTDELLAIDAVVLPNPRSFVLAVDIVRHDMLLSSSIVACRLIPPKQSLLQRGQTTLRETSTMDSTCRGTAPSDASVAVK